MGNTQSDDKVDKVISTVWLGVNDDWVSIMKDRISRIKDGWAAPVMQSLEKFSHREQRRFQKQVTEALTSGNVDENYKQQVEEFLGKNEFLREGLSNRPSSQEPTLSTSYNSLSRINESNSVSYQTEPTNEEVTKQAFQYFLVINIINDMVTNEKHPFSHMIVAFHNWADPVLKDQNGNSAILKQRICMFAKSTNEFLEYMIVALNEYLGDIDIGDLNQHLKDKQRYFNYFLSKVINEHQTSLLLESLKLVYKHNISTLETKMQSLQEYSFEIPKKYLTGPSPFLTQAECLKEIQNFSHPAAKYNCLYRTTQLIKDQLSRSASNYFLLQVTNYVVIHCQVAHLQAEVQLVELFYPNSVVQRFLQSLDFIQNIIIS